MRRSGERIPGNAGQRLSFKSASSSKKINNNINSFSSASLPGYETKPGFLHEAICKIGRFHAKLSAGGDKKKEISDEKSPF